MSLYKDRTDEKWGKVTILRRGPNNKWGQSMWWAQCDCGSPEYLVNASVLQHKGITHCSSCRSEGRRMPESGLRNLFSNYKTGAKRRNLSWELSLDEFKTLITSPCHYTGRAPSNIRSRYSSNKKPLIPCTWNGIDRKDSGKGYTVDNCVPCCTEVNLMKLDTSYSHFLDTVHEIAIQAEPEYGIESC